MAVQTMVLSAGSGAETSLYQSAVKAFGAMVGGSFDAVLRANKGLQTTADRRYTEARAGTQTIAEPRQPRAEFASAYRANSVDSKAEGGLVQNEALEKTAQVLQTVKEALKDTFGLTDEELTQAMEAAGIGMAELLQPLVLQQLTLQLSGTNEVSALLTDETLGKQLGSLLDTLQSALDEAGLSGETALQLAETPEFEAFMETAASESEAAQLQTAEQTEAPKTETAQTGAMQAEATQTEAAKMPQTEAEQAATAESVTHAAAAGETAAKAADDSNLRKEVSEEEQNTQGAEASGKQVKLTVVREAEAQAGQTGQQAKQGGAGAKETDAQAAGQYQTFLQNLTAAAEQSPLVEQSVPSWQAMDIVNQIAEQIRVVIRPEQTSMEMQLNPEHLGKISIHIASKDGVMTAQLTAQTQVAKEAMESQMFLLKESFEAQGLKVERIEVTVSDFSFQQGSAPEQQEQKKQGRRVIVTEQTEPIGFAETEMAMRLASEADMGNGASIDYTA